MQVGLGERRIMCGAYTGEHDELPDENKELTREEKVAKRIKSGDLVGRKHWDNEYAYYEYYRKDKGDEE